jgi:antitoxin (DNA-binding transcriptional repressor) of toxin-antitoxin stability system
MGDIMTAPAKAMPADPSVSMEVLETFKEFSALLERALITGERLIITRQGKPIGAIVPWEDVEILRALEDRIDGQAATEALKEPGMLSLEDVKRELGL